MKKWPIMTTLTIRGKIWLSFGILVSLLIAVGLITLSNLHANEKKLVELVNEVQPTVVLSLNLIGQLDRASASLGFYLLSKEDIYKKEYLSNLKKIMESATQLKRMPLFQRDVKASELLQYIEKKILTLESFKDNMLELALDNAKNVPAMGYASQEVNPHVREMLQRLQEMLLAEESEKVSKERKQLLIEINQLRYHFVSAINELRLYLAFRADEQVENFQSYRDVLDAEVKKLNTYDENFLSFEQFDALQNFTESYQKYFKAADRLIEIHKAEDWRQDAYIIRKDIAPLLLEIQNILTAMVKSQHETSIEDSRTLTQQVSRTQFVVSGLMMLGLFSALLIGYMLARAINNPISNLKKNAAQLAQGNLDQPIDTSRKDELGSLAQSFVEMRDAIRRKIKDLSVLNHTGERLANLHSQIDALRESLGVMAEQTRIQWGSVYLLNEQTQILEMKAYFPERETEHHQQPRTFKMGEGIAGKAAQEKKVIYISDTSADPAYVSSDNSTEEPKAIICIPLLDHNQVLGVMNFCGEVGKVSFEKTNAEFAETVARMTVVTSKNIHMLNMIEEHNRTLEQKILERTAQLRKKTNDINSMLQNMHQGIFTVYGANKIHHEFSEYLTTILETEQIADRNIMDLLFTESDLGVNAIDQINAALGALIGEDEMMFDFNSHLLVTEYTKHFSGGSSKILELDWDPIIDNGIIEKIMVTVRDVTELRVLQAEAEKQKWELEIIGQILAVSKRKFTGFIKNAYALIAENVESIQNTDQFDANVVNKLFRNMHTIKGNARTYGFKQITDVVHKVESTYDDMRKLKATHWDKARLSQELTQVKELINVYNHIYQNKLAFGDTEGIFIDTELFEKLKDNLTKIDVSNHKVTVEAMGRVKDLFNAIGTESIQSILDGVIKAIPALAHNLGKETPKVIVNDNHIRLHADAAPVLKDVFMHEFRNAVDHGIETAAERKQAGKSEQGTITVDIDRVQEKTVIRLYDDGRGLPLAKIKRMAVEKGLLQADQQVSDDQLAELVFHSGLSTADHLSDISGRGVGMDAVRQFVRKLGGEIELGFLGKHSGDPNYRPFESKIILPAEISVKVA